MNNICYFCHESIGVGDPIWILEKEKIKQVLRCSECDNQKESVIARIIGELKELDFDMKDKEQPFVQGLRLSACFIMKITEWRELLDKENI